MIESGDEIVKIFQECFHLFEKIKNVASCREKSKSIDFIIEFQSYRNISHQNADGGVVLIEEKWCSHH